MSEYKYPADDVFHQEEIKKSTFIVKKLKKAPL